MIKYIELGGRRVRIDWDIVEDKLVIMASEEPVKKTITQVAAEADGYTESKFRAARGRSIYVVAWDYIEKRLQALEEKVK